MEIAVLILVNLVVAVIMYFLFSLRFSIALEKAEKASRKTVVRELKQNIEQAIRLMDDSLDIIDQKMTVFYRLVRRAEELSAELDAKTRGGRVKKTKAAEPSREKHITQNPKNQPSYQNAHSDMDLFDAPVDAGRGKIGKKSDNFNQNSAYDADGTDEYSDERYMERILENVKGDKVEISGKDESADEIFNKGRLSTPARKETAGVPVNENAVEKLGGFVRKVFGMKSEKENSDDVNKEYFSERRETEKKIQSTFSDVLEETRMNPQIYEKKSPVKRKPPEEESVKSSDVLPAEREDQYDESLLNAKDLSERFYNTRQNPSKPDLVKYLLRHGCSVSEISKELKISPAEIDLISSLPDMSGSARKERIPNSDNV